jgi:hypothetical protein
VAAIMAKEPVAIQLRYLQTLTEIGVEKNGTVVFPLPIDIFQASSRNNRRRCADAEGKGM